MVIKIVLVVPSLRKTGVTEVVRNLLLQNKVKQCPVEFSMIVLENNYSENWNVFKKLVQNFYVLPGKSIISFHKIKKFRDIMKKIDPDEIHFHGFNSELYIPLVKNKVIVTTAHNMGIEDFIYNYGRFVGNLMARCQKCIYKYVSQIVGVSLTVSEHYKSLGFNNIVTIENGVEVPKHVVQNDVLNGLRHPIGVCVGNVDIRKNTVQILKTFREGHGIGTLLIIGDNPKDKQYFLNIKNKYQTSNVIFCGRTENVFQFLKGADYFISASKDEGLPMAAIEAMGENLDLILSNIPQHRELKKSKEDNIYFFSNKDQLIDLLKNYNTQWMAIKNANNRQNYLTHFTSSIMFNKYLQLYLDLSEKEKMK